MDRLWPWLAVVVVLGFWMLGAYNRVMALRGALLTAWLQLDALIQARQLAIGSLLDAVEPHLHTERTALDAMVSAQVQVATAAEVVRRQPHSEHPVAVLAKAEVAITGALVRVLALVDQQRELKGQAGVATPLQAIAELAPRDRFARLSFNDAAAAYNLAIEQFPTWLLARIFNFERAGLV